jgi:glycosyltransferase involved in cell wall biosynthesis
MRLVFVTPRYGPNILGGAESLVRGFAERLVHQGWRIEVWTTCAQDYYTWQNVYPTGVETIHGVIVRRFPALVYQGKDEQNSKAFGHFPDTPEAEYHWIGEGVHSPQLYHYLFKHGENFDYLIFLPYQFGLICYSASICPERSIIWPCLHDDVVAHFEPVRVMLHQAKGIILNTHAERRFLHHKLQVVPSREVIIGYGLQKIMGQATRFYKRYPYLKAPFILYAGRLEKAKNVHLLINYFIDYTQSTPEYLNWVILPNRTSMTLMPLLRCFVSHRFLKALALPSWRPG